MTADAVRRSPFPFAHVGKRTALDLFTRAASGGSADGAFYASALLRQNGFVSESLSLLVPAAEAGHAEAQAYYARLLVDGDGVARDAVAAARFARSAAEKGNTGAMMLLARVRSVFSLLLRNTC